LRTKTPPWKHGGVFLRLHAGAAVAKKDHRPAAGRSLCEPDQKVVAIFSQPQPRPYAAVELSARRWAESQVQYFAVLTQ